MSLNDSIIEWLNRQDEWLREAAHRLLSKGGLAEADITDLAALAKLPEPKPKAKSVRSFPAIGGSSSSVDLRLEAIGPVVGIDALDPKKPLEFGSGNLAVVYGANGSGKSGYTRIISKVCGKPHSVDLKANVYEGVPATQQCTIQYSIDGKKQSVDWFGADDPIDDLKAVNVFDTESGRIYLEKDNELSYQPPELSLFAGLVDVSKRVEAALLSEKAKLTSSLPTIPALHSETKAGKWYSSLSKDTAPALIALWTTWADEDQAALDSQRERMKVADPAEAARKKREQKAQIDAIHKALHQGGKALGIQARDAISRLKQDAEEKRKAASEGAKALGDVSKLEGVGSATWKAMWEAARAYSTQAAYPDKNFPQTTDGARCVLCQQDLDAEAQHRLHRFEEFVKGTLETAATEAENLLKESLKLLPTRPSPKDVITSCQAAGLADEIRDAVESAWSELEPHLAPLRKGKLSDQLLPRMEAVSQLLTQLEELSVEAEKAAAELDTDAKNPDRKEALAHVAELEGKKWVTEQAVAVQAEVERMKKLAEFDGWIGKTTTTGISRKAGELSEALITEAYVDRFNNELRRLGANKIRVELAKVGTAYGKPKHGIRLRDPADTKAQVAGVLSEGERRIVALAAFIADVTGHRFSSPLVFDDPISSLDQIFEEKVIARLVALSKERQVLVFTHRLSFLGMMYDLAGSDLHDVHIRREPWGTGQPGDVPLFGKRPDKALNNLKGERVAKARKAYEDGYDSYYPLAKAICSDFRILMERIVETVFLADVIQRHRRAVNTMGKIGSLVKIEKSDCDLIDAMMTKYSCYEHSQSEEAPIDVPGPDDLEDDIQRMIQWHEEFSKRDI